MMKPPESSPLHSACRNFMKLGSIVLFFSLAGGAALADYSMLWFNMSGGGGMSTNSQYSLRGTIGQPDAGGAMTNGTYSVNGGFWVVTFVPTPDAPTLHLTNAAPGSVTLWWTPPAPGYVLRFTDNLTSGSWSNAPSGTNNPVTVPTVGLARFYRLTKP